jgi:hypothetical protein
MPRQDYEQRVQARQERLEARADRLMTEGTAKVEAGFKMFDAIPFGQPILVGHYSEKRDRNYRAKAGNKIDSGFAMRKEAGEVAARAAAVGSAGVSSDDPNGIAKLTEKVAELEARQAKMKAANDAWRKAGNKAGRNAAGEWIEPPYASYQLSNNNAVIRSTKARIAQLEREATRESQTVETNVGVTAIQDVDTNRVKLVFPGKPDAETIAQLKGRGFRWSPSEGAWQRMLNNAGVYAAKAMIEWLTARAA